MSERRFWLSTMYVFKEKYDEQSLNNHQINGPALVAQLDVRPTGDQEVAGSTPARSATSFLEIWSWNIFYGHSLLSADSRRAVASFWRKNVHNTG